ncbi:hypothetical protein ACO0LO_28515 [Undibacterium sp. TJN25]|uniref:hypothetical protein n=1 Tax=Undibacterium sp. TJN25 TaxID=3413056 RepID=UPI003BEF67E5
MQILIVALILMCAAAYLGWRWMPQMLKKDISGWVARHAPALSPYLQASSGGCSSGCSSCSNSNADSTGCSTEAMPDTNSQGRRVIHIKPQQ